MTMDSFEVNQNIKLQGSFTLGGVATDPTEISLKILTPAGTETEYLYSESQLTRDGAGIYSLEMVVTQEGVYHYGWVGTGDVKAAVNGVFVGKLSPFT